MNQSFFYYRDNNNSHCDDNLDKNKYQINSCSKNSCECYKHLICALGPIGPTGPTGPAGSPGGPTGPTA